MTGARPRMLLNVLQHVEQPPVTEQLSGPTEVPRLRALMVEGAIGREIGELCLNHISVLYCCVALGSLFHHCG